MELPDWLAGARRICVLTGAGISTDSGIPDYRGPDGLWTRDPDAEKLATVYFGEALDAAVMDAAAQAAAECDVFLAVGTSLGVHPAAGLVEIAAAHGARIVIVNAQPTLYDRLADLVVREPIGTALPALLAFAH